MVILRPARARCCNPRVGGLQVKDIGSRSPLCLIHTTVLQGQNSNKCTVIYQKLNTIFKSESSVMASWSASRSWVASTSLGSYGGSGLPTSMRSSWSDSSLSDEISPKSRYIVFVTLGCQSGWQRSPVGAHTQKNDLLWQLVTCCPSTFCMLI